MTRKHFRTIQGPLDVAVIYLVECQNQAGSKPTWNYYQVETSVGVDDFFNLKTALNFAEKVAGITP